jgi:hypothetical protein
MSNLNNLFQRPEWIAEASAAILAVGPRSAAVVHAMRGYGLPGIPGLPPLSARLADGSQWEIKDGHARRLTDGEIAERDARLASYHFGD